MAKANEGDYNYKRLPSDDPRRIGCEAAIAKAEREAIQVKRIIASMYEDKAKQKRRAAR